MWEARRRGGLLRQRQRVAWCARRRAGAHYGAQHGATAASAMVKLNGSARCKNRRNSTTLNWAHARAREHAVSALPPCTLNCARGHVATECWVTARFVARRPFARAAGWRPQNIHAPLPSRAVCVCASRLVSRYQIYRRYRSVRTATHAALHRSHCVYNGTLRNCAVLPSHRRLHLLSTIHTVHTAQRALAICRAVQIFANTPSNNPHCYCM